MNQSLNLIINQQKSIINIGIVYKSEFYLLKSQFLVQSLVECTLPDATNWIAAGNANNDALKTLLDGDADAMWVYADQAG